VLPFKKYAQKGNKIAISPNKDTIYKVAKPKEKDYSFNDGGGLYLFA
jgi:hypothetical protein